MPFANYQSVADVARPFRIHFRRENFVWPLSAPLSDYFRSELDFTLREVPFDDSESAACETLIYPFLREVWRAYLEALTLWSQLIYQVCLIIWWPGGRPLVRSF